MHYTCRIIACLQNLLTTIFFFPSRYIYYQCHIILQNILLMYCKLTLIAKITLILWCSLRWKSLYQRSMTETINLKQIIAMYTFNIQFNYIWAAKHYVFVCHSQTRKKKLGTIKLQPAWHFKHFIIRRDALKFIVTFNLVFGDMLKNSFPLANYCIKFCVHFFFSRFELFFFGNKWFWLDEHNIKHSTKK